MNISKLLGNLKLNKIRNMILYASFIILIVSLTFPLQDIENSLVQSASFSFFIYGLFLWGVERVMGPLVESINDDLGGFFSVVLWIALVIIGFIITFKIAFGVEFTEVIQLSNWLNSSQNG